MARIKLDRDRSIGQVDRRVFGGFVEHLGRCVYGGVFDEHSSLADDRGFRTDVLDAIRPLRAPLLRWPGGNFASGYHWTDGIGPRDQRPKRVEIAWGTEESNRFGTDEFIAYCRELDAEPYICLNMGTGTLDEALAWVEYCNGTGDTYWANRRRIGGHPEPYNVRYWGLGNEMYGDWQIGSLTAEEYVANARRWALALRRLDPGLVLIGCGLNGWSEWDRVVIDGMIKYVDFHSVHIYTGSHDYWANVLAPHQAERAISTAQSLVDRARYLQRVDHPVHVAYDEWNVWFRTADNQLDERYTLADALAVATYLNVFLRHCSAVRMANLAQMVNVIAPVVTSTGGLFAQTIYHPLRLAAQHTQSVALDVHVDCPKVEHTDPEGERWPHRIADLGPFPVLDVAATRDEDSRRFVVSVVNRDPDHAIATTVELADVTAARVVARTVTGDDPKTTNSFDHPDAVRVTEVEGPAGSDRIEHTFPPHSMTQLEIETR